MRKKKNVYYGKGISTANIQIDKTKKVDKAIEVATLAYAVAYDAANKLLLTRTEKLKKATINVINGRFKVLYILAKKLKASKRIWEFIRKMHSLAIQRLTNKIDFHSYIAKIRKIALQYLPVWIVNHVETQINRYNDMKHMQMSMLGFEQKEITKIIKKVFI